ncbi:replication protein [Aneurinibacillus thermoaerophilus]|uniref:DnaD and phage-associated domain-containing protein n=1 Tax=Aneurinibacillus thermoaerophilus TaxID=143495 RepID=A0A1G8AP10_ANETH|nr:replication protein [Aneurinibacillus thermoaerophilus]MED0758752.1 replication protein [Aneurinibacillus thermoaerophilus]MED0760590.1 replication protein [Aneurinibacillus thermoaerophilus]SDH22772.1 DnaD and phage-associated domain-containing protein [Aneurinibacillus thermoaerophilus]
MANPQIENGFIKIANELWDEILRRNFTKRQQNIIMFIWRMSYGCGQKDCVIDKFNYFELAGLDKSDIKKELKYLKMCNVIHWDEETMTFAINKNYDFWQINPNKNWDDDKFKKLIASNLQRKKVGEIPTNEEDGVGKIPTLYHDEVGKTPTIELVKYQPQEASMPRGTSDSSSLNTILNTNINTTSTTTIEPAILFEQCLTWLSPIQRDRLNKWVDEFGGNKEIVNLAIRIADDSNKRNFNFVNFLLNEWHNNNLKTVEQIQTYERQKFNQAKKRTGKTKVTEKHGRDVPDDFVFDINAGEDWL